MLLPVLAAMAAGCGISGQAIDPGLLAPPSCANPDRFEPFTFVLAGDPQIGFGLDGAWGDQKRLITEFRQCNELSPAFVLIAGDLVHEGLASQWLAFARALRELTVPVKIVLGNHDLAPGYEKILAEYRSRFGMETFAFTYNNCEFIGINSVALRSEDASDTETQRQWRGLEESLSRAQAAGRDHIFLLMHHPPYLHRADERGGWNGNNWPPAPRARLLAMAQRYGARYFLCGHNHRTWQLSDEGREIYAVGGTSLAWDRKTGYRVFHVTRDGVRQQFMPLDQPQPSPPKAE